MENLTAPKKKIGRTLIIGILTLLLLLGIVLAVLGTLTFRGAMMERYHSLLESLLRLTAAQIDADDLARCIESGVKSEGYLATQEYLDDMKNNCDIKYVYVVKPLNDGETDNMMNVIAGVSDEERTLYADILVQLGQLTGTEYSPEVAQMYLGRMDRSDSITYYGNVTEFGHMYTGLMPLHDSAGEPVAILAIDIEMGKIQSIVLRYNLITGSAVVMLALLALGSAYLWLRKRIIQPIEQLELASSSFVASARTAQTPEELRYDPPDIHTQDEMEVLSNALLSMSEDMKGYMRTLVQATAEKERIGAELSVAKQIQADILPNDFPAFPERNDFDVVASMKASREIGGDFFDYFLIDEDHLGLVVGDVSGKGVPAAMFMVSVKTLIKNRAVQGFSPAEVLQSVSEQLMEGNKAGMFATVWFAVLELSTGKGVAVNAGHEHPILSRAGKRYEFQKYRHSPPVAAMEGVRFRDHGFQLEPGDALFIYTDGAQDAENEKAERFGPDRLLEVLNREPKASPSILLQTVQEALERFIGDAQQFDDITLLSLKYYGKGEMKAEWK